MPQLQISTDLRYGYLKIISGAINRSVPHLSYDSLDSECELSPKSISLSYPSVNRYNTWFDVSMDNILRMQIGYCIKQFDNDLFDMSFFHFNSFDELSQCFALQIFLDNVQRIFGFFALCIEYNKWRFI